LYQNNNNNTTFCDGFFNEKEEYIANMLVRTLYSNKVNNSECYHIIKLFKEKILGNVQI